MKYHKLIAGKDDPKPSWSPPGALTINFDPPHYHRPRYLRVCAETISILDQSNLARPSIARSRTHLASSTAPWYVEYF